jgi:hypothetical protein
LRTVFGTVPLSGAKGYRRFASRTLLPLGSIVPNFDFHSLTSAKRCCLAHATAWRKEKSARY